MNSDNDNDNQHAPPAPVGGAASNNDDQHAPPSPCGGASPAPVGVGSALAKGGTKCFEWCIKRV